MSFFIITYYKLEMNVSVFIIECSQYYVLALSGDVRCIAAMMNNFTEIHILPIPFLLLVCFHYQ